MNDEYTLEVGPFVNMVEGDIFTINNKLAPSWISDYSWMVKEVHADKIGVVRKAARKVAAPAVEERDEIAELLS